MAKKPLPNTPGAVEMPLEPTKLRIEYKRRASDQSIDFLPIGILIRGINCYLDVQPEVANTIIVKPRPQ